MNIATVGDSVFLPDGPCFYPPKGIYTAKGFIITGSSTLFVNGKAAAREGDQAMAGGVTWLISSSSKLFIEGKRAHRVGDKNSCLGNTIGPGQPNLLIGD